MRARWLILLAFSVLAVFGVRGQGAAGDKAKIRGTWQVVSLEGGGKEQLLTDSVYQQIVIAAHKLTLRVLTMEVEMGYRLDPSKKPKAIDLLTGKKGGKVLPGIYLLEGDTLKLCWDTTGKARPTRFATQGNRGDVRLLILKREGKK